MLKRRNEIKSDGSNFSFVLIRNMSKTNEDNDVRRDMSPSEDFMSRLSQGLLRSLM